GWGGRGGGGGGDGGGGGGRATVPARARGGPRRARVLPRRRGRAAGARGGCARSPARGGGRRARAREGRAALSAPGRSRAKARPQLEVHSSRHLDALTRDEAIRAPEQGSDRPRDVLGNAMAAERGDGRDVSLE